MPEYRLQQTSAESGKPQLANPCPPQHSTPDFPDTTDATARLSGSPPVSRQHRRAADATALLRSSSKRGSGGGARQRGGARRSSAERSGDGRRRSAAAAVTGRLPLPPPVSGQATLSPNTREGGTERRGETRPAATDHRRPAATGQRPAASDQWPAISDQQSTTSGC